MSFNTVVNASAKFNLLPAINQLSAPSQLSKRTYSKKVKTLDGKSFTLLKKYIDLIRSGKKTVEGRVRTGAFEFAKAGDLVSFYTYQGDRISCRVKKVKNYDTFREMLTNEGVSNCLPGLSNSNIDEAVKIYHSIPKYEEKAKAYGVVALQILVEDPHPIKETKKRKRDVSIDANKKSELNTQNKKPKN